MPDNPIPLGIYQHFKGQYYLVTGIAADGNNGLNDPQNCRVFYTALYGEFRAWHRTLANFTSVVQSPMKPLERIPRFSFVCINPLALPEQGTRALAALVPILKAAGQAGKLPISDLPENPPE